MHRGPGRFRPPVPLRLADPVADRVRRNTDDQIRELQAVPLVRGRVIRDVELEDGVETAIAHGLGHRAAVLVSPPRWKGATGTHSSPAVMEYRAGDRDPEVYVVLKATGFGATVVVDLWIF